MRAQLGDRVRVQFSRLPVGGDFLARPLRLHILEFAVGSDHALPGLSRHVLGMSQGEQKVVTLEPGEAYGVVQPHLIRELPRNRIRAKSTLVLGMHLTARRQRWPLGRKFRIIELNRNSVLVDGNHPSAGRAVRLRLLLVTVDSSSDANQSKPQFDSGGES